MSYLCLWWMWQVQVMNKIWSCLQKWDKNVYCTSQATKARQLQPISAKGKHIDSLNSGLTYRAHGYSWLVIVEVIITNIALTQNIPMIFHRIFLHWTVQCRFFPLTLLRRVDSLVQYTSLFYNDRIAFFFN